ncbi:MAG: GC-type dockerin domain-anchored protein [Planctomycetota bacterium]
MMKSALVLAAMAGTAVAGDVSTKVEAKGLGLPDWRVLADSRDDINKMGWVYQTGNERVIVFDRPTNVARNAGRAGEVTSYQYQEPLFDTWGTGACPNAIELFGQLFPDDGVNPPTYEAWEGTAQFAANTVIDTIGFAASALDEDPATAGDSVTDGVPFNDVIIIVEEQENAVDSNFTDTLTRFGVAVLELAGSDFPPPAGQVDVFNYTIDLTADPDIADDGIEFEAGDDDGTASEACIQADDFNANVFLDSGLQLVDAPYDNDSLHDASFTMFFLQPTSDFTAQIDPQSASDRAQIIPQGFLLGIGDPFSQYDPTDQAGTFPDIASQTPGNGVASLDLIKLWDLTVPPAALGPDFTADPFVGEWLNEDGGANIGGGFRITATSRIDFFDANPFIEAETGLSPFDIVCDAFTLTSLDGLTTVNVDASGGSEPYIAFLSPTPGTCGAPAGDPPCNDADLADPKGILDLSDVDAFIPAFLASDEAADIAPPFGVVDLSDVDLFIALFLGGCP